MRCPLSTNRGVAPPTDLLTTVSSRTYPRWGQRSVSPERMDNDDTQSTCADCTTTDITVELPPVEATVCAVNKEKTTKKARRKANKDQADAVWKVCVPNCFHNGNNNKGNVVQCHLCQTWIHPECVGQNDSDIVGIWTCPTCRTLPVLVQQLLDRSPCWSRCLFASRNPTCDSLSSWASNERR